MQEAPRTLAQTDVPLRVSHLKVQAEASSRPLTIVVGATPSGQSEKSQRQSQSAKATPGIISIVSANVIVNIFIILIS
jgi:hypothetical protein